MFKSQVESARRLIAMCVCLVSKVNSSRSVIPWSLRTPYMKEEITMQQPVRKEIQIHNTTSP